MKFASRIALAPVFLLALVASGCGDKEPYNTSVTREFGRQVELESKVMDDRLNNLYEQLREIVRRRDALNVRIHDTTNGYTDSVREDLKVRRADILAEAEKLTTGLSSKVEHLESSIKFLRAEAQLDDYFEPNDRIFTGADEAEARIPALKKKVNKIKDRFSKYLKGERLPKKLD